MADEDVSQPQAEPLSLRGVGWEAELAELRQRQALARELGGKDRVARQHAGGRLTVRGRADDVIITGGEKVVAGEVAALLETCPGVREAAVVGRPDAEWGERVTAVIVPDNPVQPPTLDLLCRHVRERLPRYALPRELVLRASMPMLPSGKPDLEALRREQSPAGNVSR